ncbi:ADP-ribosylhydrolase ARH3 isoform X2 [Manis javanica]|uniref:ADP-ribosylhydrolase ARH3 isoform X2 n=1 Tax=Manis javanica TaxID=9974 RepID=UPI00187AA495|nr:ADP-ribose glycohydrolase ARH3 isoform X2 [Manis javanica]
MARALVQSLLAKEAFDEVDMAHRFAQEYKKDPDRGYGAGVITVFRKLLSPKCRDVYEPAQAQFNGKGSYGNGGAMRVAGISLAYSSVQDVQKFARLSAQLTHASSLGYNGAILQALAVHLALQGESSSEHFLEQLLGHMEELESDAQSISDARELGMEERPYSSRLKKIGALLGQNSVTREEVVCELGRSMPSCAASLRFRDCRDSTRLHWSRSAVPVPRARDRSLAAEHGRLWGTCFLPRTAPSLPSALGLALALPSGTKGLALALPSGTKIHDFIHNLYQMLKLGPWDPEPAVMLHYP